MDSTLHLHPNPKGWLFNGILVPHVDAFVEHLRQGPYTHNTINKYLSCIAHFARRMEQSRLAVEGLDEAAITRFLGDHLPRCDCPWPVCRVHSDLRAACGHLLRVLRQNAVVVERAAASGPIEDELLRFDEHMRNVQGLAAKMRPARIHIVHRLLLARLASRPVIISALQPDDVRQFVSGQMERRGTVSNASALALALRAYFRYRTTWGDRVHALAGVIGSPAHWSLALLPRSLSAAEIERLLRSFTPDLLSLRRGYDGVLALHEQPAAPRSVCTSLRHRCRRSLHHNLFVSPAPRSALQLPAVPGARSSLGKKGNCVYGMTLVSENSFATIGE